jgi:hypothetical protein
MRYIQMATITLAVLLTAGCKKEGIKETSSREGLGVCNPVDQKNSLVGTWELRSKFLGYSGQQQSYTSGNGNLIKFTTTTYSIYSNGQLVRSGNYTLQSQKSNIMNKVMSTIKTNNSDFQEENFVNLENNELTLFMDAMDGTYTKYIKQ